MFCSPRRDLAIRVRHARQSHTRPQRRAEPPEGAEHAPPSPPKKHRAICISNPGFQAFSLQRERHLAARSTRACYRILKCNEKVARRTPSLLPIQRRISERIPIRRAQVSRSINFIVCAVCAPNCAVSLVWKGVLVGCFALLDEI